MVRRAGDDNKEMKMVTLVSVLLVAALATPALSVGEETSATTTSTVQNSEANQGLRGPIAGRTGGNSGVQKQFFYGRKFELPKDSRDKKDGSYSPLIINPIRALPSLSEQHAEKDRETISHYQNEIFSNIRDLFQETAKVTLNKSQFSEKGKEEDSYAEEATTILYSREDLPGENSSSTSKSRQDGDRSLLVVLPFKAEGDNMEDLFTKSPLVKVIESDEKDKDQTTTSHPPLRREIIPTTEQNPVTRKRWRPLKRDDTTSQSPVLETTTESKDLTKNYTNYNDVELITKKYDAQVDEAQNLANHNFEADLDTPFPIYKRWRDKAKQDRDEQPEGKDTAEDPKSLGKSEKPKNSVEGSEKPRPIRGKGQRRKPTTEGPPKPEDLSKVLDVLPPDMKELILHIGLNKEGEQRPNESNIRLERPPQPTIDPKSYAVFKPLPLEEKDEHGSIVPEDMKDFLASFGLLPLGRRVQKSLKSGVISPKRTENVETMSGADLDFLPEELKSLLESMGLTKNQDKKEPTRIHIFNPSNHSIAHSEEEFEKLNAILSSIKEAVNKSETLTGDMQSKVAEKSENSDNFRHQNGNLSAINNESKKVAFNSQVNANVKTKTTAKRATKLIEGPDPLMFSEESLLKNDVKRQADISSSSSSSASSSSSSSSASSSSSSSSSFSSSSASSDSSSSAVSESAAETTTEESPNIEALKESFGGGETASDDADIESSLPPKRPNGLYLLLDWNSFLEVGTEDDSRRVNLRFQPKIGDSRNFLPVSVP